MGRQGWPSAKGTALRGWLWPILIVVVLLGSWLRQGLWSEPLWIDELHTSWCALGDWSQLTERTAAGNQSPLYFGGQKILGSMVQDFGPSLRLTSWLAGWGLIALVMFLTERWTKSPLAVLVAAAWVVVDADSVFYSIEARPYALLMLVSTLHITLGLGRFLGGAVSGEASDEGQGSRHYGLRAGWVLTGALMVHLHSTSLLLLGVEWLVVVAALAIRRWRAGAYPLGTVGGKEGRLAAGMGGLFVDVAFILLLITPLVPQLMDVGGRRNAWREFVNGSWEQAWPLIRLGIAAVVVPGGGWVMSWAWVGLGRRWQRVDSSAACPPREVVVEPVRWVWIASIGTGTVLGAAVLTYSEVAPVLLIRYLVAVLPLAALTSGLLVGSIPGPWLRLATAVASLCFLGSTDRMVQYWWETGVWPPARIEGWDECVATINDGSAEHWPVVLYPSLIEERQLADEPDESLVQYLCFPLQSAYPLEGDPGRLIPASPSGTPVVPVLALEKLNRSGGLWVVVRDRPDQPVILWGVLESLDRDLAAMKDQFTIDRYQFGAVHLLRVRRLGTAANEERPPQGS